MEKNKRIYDKGFTHGGNFHADDVFSTALLLIINPGFKYERGNVVPEEYDGIIYDIGLGRFDHHQKDNKIRTNGIPYASFGLLWEEYGELLLSKEDMDLLDEEFVQKIDLNDNCGGDYEISKIIREMNPDGGNEEDYNKAFDKAVSIAVVILKNKISKYIRKRENIKLVSEYVKKTRNGILVLDRYSTVIRELRNDTSGKLKIVIYPSNRCGYNVQTIRNCSDVTFPESWRGADKEELCKMTGIPEFVFCHQGGFLGVTETLDAAKTIADRLISKSM